MDEAAPAPGAPGSLSTKSSSFRRSLVPSGSPTDAEKDSGEEETGQSRPFKPKSVFANISALTVSAEVVATLDIGSTDILLATGHDSEFLLLLTSSELHLSPGRTWRS